MKILLEGGTVYDGTGSSPIQADVFLDSGMIQRVLPRGGEGNRESQLLKEKLPNGKIRRLDVRGKAVAPGFIDAHRHGDYAVLTDPDFGEAELAQGITTESPSTGSTDCSGEQEGMAGFYGTLSGKGTGGEDLEYLPGVFSRSGKTEGAFTNRSACGDGKHKNGDQRILFLTLE